MSRSKHTEAQMIAAVKQLEAGRKAEDVAREVGVSTHTIYAWKSKYCGMDVSEAQEAKRLRDENGRLRKLVADLSLDKEALQSVIEKNGWSSQRGSHLWSTPVRSSPSPSVGPAACCWFRFRVIATRRASATTVYASVWLRW